MKKVFKQQLYDYAFSLITRNNWEIDKVCERDIDRLIDTSIEKLSHQDCSREEMRQFAKTNLLHLLAYMHLDAKKRGLDHLDSASLPNALSNFNSLWPFKGTEASPKKETPLYMQNPEFTWYY